MSKSSHSLAGAIKVIKHFVPDFEILAKATSTKQRILAKVNFFNQKYMTNYWTTEGSKIYFPTEINDDSWKILFHEAVHSQDSKRIGGLLFNFLYCCPAILAPIFIIGGFFYWPAFIAAAVLMLPIPSPFRAWCEFRGYSVTQAIEFWTGKRVDTAWIENQMVPYFAGWSYYKMFAFKPFVRWYFQRNLEKLKSGQALEDPYMKAVHDYCKVGDVSK